MNHELDALYDEHPANMKTEKEKKKNRIMCNAWITLHIFPSQKLCVAGFHSDLKVKIS